MLVAVRIEVPAVMLGLLGGKPSSGCVLFSLFHSQQSIDSLATMTWHHLVDEYINVMHIRTLMGVGGTFVYATAHKGLCSSGWLLIIIRPLSFANFLNHLKSQGYRHSPIPG